MSTSSLDTTSAGTVPDPFAPLPSAAVTLFSKHDNTGQPALLSKRIALDPQNQKPVSDGTPCRMWVGEAQHRGVPDAPALAALIEGMTSDQALAIGTMQDDPFTRRTDGKPVPIASRTALRGGTAPRDAIPRSLDSFEFRKGPGWLLLDVDLKGAPDALLLALRAGKTPWDYIVEAAPGLAGAEHVVRASTSAGLSDTSTGTQFPGSGGLHIYILVQDITDARRAVRALHQRLWLHDGGWFWISVAGSLLERSLMDISVASPERLVFEGAPDVLPPLVQDAAVRQPKAIAGQAVDTHAVLPDLTEAERQTYTSLVRTARDAKASEAATVRDAKDLADAREIADRTKMPLSVTVDHVRLRHAANPVLMPSLMLEFDDPSIGAVPVADVLADPGRFVGETLADPIEGVAYGRCKAKVMPEKGPHDPITIHSFAHGRTIYRLHLDLAMARDIIAGADPNAVVSEVVALAPRMTLDAETVARLIDAAVDRDPRLSKTTVRKRIEVEQRRIQKAENAERQRQAADDGGRLLPLLDAPALDAELEPTLRAIDTFAAQAVRGTSAPTFVRNLAGVLCCVDEAPMAGLHTLRGDAVHSAPDYLPAAQPARLREMSALETTMAVAQAVRFRKADPAGNRPARYVRIPETFAVAYRTWTGGDLPRVSGIATLPLLLPDRRVAMDNGVDESLNLLFRINPALLDVVPRQDEATAAAAQDAYRFLADEWLADVDTDAEGKAGLIALALTMLARPALPERPAFFVTAGLAGSGKTTTLHLIVTAINGGMAVATPWSANVEERRKSLLAFQVAGVDLLTFDNIENGAQLSCPVIEQSLTGPDREDRLLGVSETRRVPSTTVIAFTGNNIAPRGDLASRSLMIRLSASRVDPENRTFAHPDPIGWTMAHRRKILRSLYLVGLVERAQADARTRFKTWWRVVGQPIEIASGGAIDFAAAMVAARRTDDEASDVSDLFVLLRARFGTSRFIAATVAEAMDTTHPLGKGKDEIAWGASAHEALQAVTKGRFVPPGVALSAKAVGKRLGQLVGRVVQVGGQTVRLDAQARHDKTEFMLAVLSGAEMAVAGSPAAIVDLAVVRAGRAAGMTEQELATAAFIFGPL